MSKSVRIFVSHSHQDSRHVDRKRHDSLLGFLAGLEQEEGVEFWVDQKLRPGDDWDAEIKRQIAETDIALVLVSQAYLDSPYCKETELPGFLRRNTLIFPVVLSACDWARHEWLRTRQYLPAGGETIEEHYRDSGRRKRLFNEIRKQLLYAVELQQKIKTARSDLLRTLPAQQFDSAVLNFLPYFCDRGKQIDALDAALAAHLKKPRRRPLVVLIHGPHDESLGGFVERLTRTLPRWEATIEKVSRLGPIFFRDPGTGRDGDRLIVLKRKLARQLCESADADLVEMADRVARYRCPVIIEIAFSVTDRNPSSEESQAPNQKLLSSWLELLADWPDLPVDPSRHPYQQLVMFFLTFSYKDRQPCPLLFWKPSIGAQIESLLQSLAEKSLHGLNIVALPRLESISKTDAMHWISRHACEAARGASRGIDLLVFKERLLEAIDQLFQTESERQPMRRLAPKLRKQLLRCLDSRG